VTEPQLDPDPAVSEQMHHLADEIVRRLSADELPAYISDFIRDDAAEHGVRSSHAVVYPGSHPIYAEFELHPDGSLWIRLNDWNGQIFWRKHLRPGKA
jgi:hypothetical protein